MALHHQTHPASGPTHLVRRLPAASLALVERLHHLAHAGLSVCSDTRLRRGRSLAGEPVAAAVDEIRADDGLACLERPEDHHGGAPTLVEA
jgi:hypothetical protein